MGIHFSWDDDAQTILRFDMDGRWTWDEFDAKASESLEWRQDRTRPYSVIMNNTADAFAPPESINHLKQIMERGGDTMELFVIIGGDRFAKMVGSAFSQVYRHLGKKLVFSNTLQDARTLIREARTAKVLGKGANAYSSFRDLSAQ